MEIVHRWLRNVNVHVEDLRVSVLRVSVEQNLNRNVRLMEVKSAVVDVVFQ